MKPRSIVEFVFVDSDVLKKSIPAAFSSSLNATVSTFTHHGGLNGCHSRLLACGSKLSDRVGPKEPRVLSVEEGCMAIRIWTNASIHR